MAEDKKDENKSKIKLSLKKVDSAKIRLASKDSAKGGAVTVQVKRTGARTPNKDSRVSTENAGGISESERLKRLELLKNAKFAEKKTKVSLSMPVGIKRELPPQPTEVKPVEKKKEEVAPKKVIEKEKVEVKKEVAKKIELPPLTKKSMPKKEVSRAESGRNMPLVLPTLVERPKPQEIKKVEQKSSPANKVLPNKISLKKNWDDGSDKKTTTKPKVGEQKRRGKMTLTTVLDDSERHRSLASIKRARAKEKKERLLQGIEEKTQEKIIRDVIITEAITISELASRMAEKTADVIKELMKLDIMATANQIIDADTAEIIVQEFGHRFTRVAESDVEERIKDTIETDEGKLQSRAPVVTIMGHVDHGKTSLLDALREARVAEGEAGGITQHIGAYQVSLDKSDNNVSGKITFIDTPGHAAFTEMRARGTKVTDIVILVVAADDGIKDQTIEAINHAKAAKTPIIVPCNKIDKPEANSQMLKTALLSHEIVVEEMGGEVMFVEVSAKKKIGLDKLKEAILLQSEVLELKANPDTQARGTVIEARIDKGRGTVATVIISKGTLKVGQIVLAGNATGKVRALSNDLGKNIKQALPSTPVEVVGLDKAPAAGDELVVVENEKIAREITEYRIKKEKNIRAAADSKMAMDKLFNAPEKNKYLTVIIKADVHGSIEAITGSLAKLNNDEVDVKVVHSAVGGITESDVTLAKASDAMIIAFNVRANNQAKELAARDDIDIRYYSVIYDVVDEAKAALEGLLTPEKKEEFIGYAEIREVFSTSKFGKIAGCYVTEGNVKRGAGVRLLRDSVVIHEGTLKTLKRFKDEVKEVASGYECGMAFENYDDIKVKDVIEAFEIVETKRTL